jgi:hypothetical protein
MTARWTFWHDSMQPDENEAHVLARWQRNVPTGRRCRCGRPVLKSSLCGCHCSEHDVPWADPDHDVATDFRQAMASPEYQEHYMPPTEETP